MPGTILKSIGTTSQADGTVVSASNTNLTALSIGSGNSFTFQSAAAMSGSFGFRMNQGGANQLSSYCDLASVVTGVFAWREIFRYTTTPSVSTTIRRFFPDTVHTANLGSLTITSTNRMQFIEGGTGSPLNVTSPSGAGSTLAPGSIYSLIGKIDLVANTFALKVYPYGSATALFTLSGNLGADMAAAAGIQSMRFGISTASSGIGNFDLNDKAALGSGDWLARSDYTNQAPTANAGADQSVGAGANVTLNGTGSSDPDGDAITYDWAHVSGPYAGSLSSSTAASPTYTATGSGTDVWQLIVTDEWGLASAADTVSITVGSATVNAGPDQSVLGGTTITLAGSSSNGTYAWTQTAGTAVSLSATNVAGPTFTSPAATSTAQTLTFQLSNGAGQTDSVSITILPAGVLKRLNTTPQTDGTAQTPSNSNWSSLSPGSGNTAVHSDAAKMGAAAGYRMTQGGANQNIAYMDFDAPVGVLGLLIPFQYSATPPAPILMLRLYDNTGHTGNLGTFSITTTDRFQFVEGGTGSPLNVTSTGTVLVPDAYYILRILIDLTNNTMEARIHPYGSAATIITISGPLGADAAAASGISSIRWSIGASSVLVGGYLDTNSNFTAGQGGWLPRYDVANNPPAANAGPDQTIMPGAPFTLNGSGSSDLDGLVVVWDWTRVSGPAVTLAGTGANRAGTAPYSMTSQVAVFQLVVTDDLGLTSTPDTVSISIPAHSHWYHNGTAWKPEVPMTL